MKAEVYETWAVINRAFEQVISAFDKLQEKGILTSDYVHNQSTITNDLWAKINCHILAAVAAREEDARTHYGKMSATLHRKTKR